jgi:hypothetical protein
VPVITTWEDPTAVPAGIVRVAVPEPDMTVGLTDAPGIPVAVSCTESEKPLTEPMVMVEVAWLPKGIVNDVGLAEIVKSA